MKTPILFSLCLFITIYSKAQPLTLDNTFALNGVFQYSDGATNEEIVDTEILSDGNILLLGNTNYDPDEGGNSRIVVIKLNPKGEIDASFGKIYIDTPLKSDIANGFVIQADGKIVIAAENRTDFKGIIYRFNSNGTLDISFGSNGSTSFNLGFISFENIALQGEKIVVSGNVIQNNIYSYLIGRFNSNGQVDLTFNNVGYNIFRTSAINSEEDDHAGYGLAVQSDGRILSCGYNEKADGTVIRLTKNGQLDTTFGLNGKGFQLYANLNFAALEIDDDKIVLSGSEDKANSSSDKLIIARLNNNGNTDGGFGVAGVARFGKNIIAGFKNDIVIQSDGKYISCYSNQIIRVNPNGSLDKSFDNEDGIYIHPDLLFTFKGLDLKNDKIIANGYYLTTNTTYDGFVMSLNNNFSTSIKEEGKNDLLKLYPNPAHDRITIEAEGNPLKSLHVFNSLGQLVSTINFYNNYQTEHQIDVSNYLPGIYSVRVVNQNSGISIKSFYVE